MRILENRNNLIFPGILTEILNQLPKKQQVNLIVTLTNANVATGEEINGIYI